MGNFALEEDLKSRKETSVKHPSPDTRAFSFKLAAPTSNDNANALDPVRGLTCDFLFVPNVGSSAERNNTVAMSMLQTPKDMR